jgi:hypothetical protein
MAASEGIENLKVALASDVMLFHVIFYWEKKSRKLLGKRRRSNIMRNLLVVTNVIVAQCGNYDSKERIVIVMLSLLLFAN